MSDTLRLAVSNLAWDMAEDAEIASLLGVEGVPAIEVVPTKWRDDPLSATAREVATYRRTWADRGLNIVAMQALLFGRPDLQLFGDTRPAMQKYLRDMITLGAELGAHALVFGAPKNRVRGTLPFDDAVGIAIDFFRPLGDHAANLGVWLCIEANPREYGCDFITTTAEAVALCNLINNRGIAVNGDLGGMTMVGDEPRGTITAAANCMQHFHASEPELDELGAESDHGAAASGLAAMAYEGWVSIEMHAGERGSNVARVGRAVRLAKYRYEAVVGGLEAKKVGGLETRSGGDGKN